MKGNRFKSIFAIGGGDFAVGNPACIQGSGRSGRIFWEAPIGEKGVCSIPIDPDCQDSVKSGRWGLALPFGDNKGNV